jgi:hypothetical protein
MKISMLPVNRRNVSKASRFTSSTGKNPAVSFLDGG